MKQKDGSLKPAYQGSDTQQTGHWDPVLQRYVSCHDIRYFITAIWLHSSEDITAIWVVFF